MDPAYLNKVYSDIDLSDYVKNVCIDIVEKKNQFYKTKIDKEDNFYPAEKGEQDHKALIRKWNAQITSGQLLNKLVKPNDTVKTKQMIKTNLDLLKNNPDNFRLSNGFKGLENTLGSDKIDLLTKDKRIQDEQVKTYRERTPVYTERKKLTDAVNTEKLRKSQMLVEKVSKTQRDIEQNKLKKLEMLKKREELEKKKEEELAQKLQEEKEEILQKRKDELEKRKREKKNSISNYSTQDEKMLQYLKQKPRYKKMEEDFTENIESEGLLKKKRILASLRDLHQPLNMREIEEEQEKYVDIIRQNNERKKQELIEKLKEHQEKYDYQKFHGKYMEKLIEDEYLHKEQQFEQEERKRNYRENMRDYDEIIKKKYQPVVSHKKAEEIEKIKEELTMNPRDKIRRSSPVIHSDKEELRQIARKRKKIFEWKNSLKPPTPAPKKEFERKNFLRDFQQELQEEFERTGKKPIPIHRNWEQDLRTQSLSSIEKFKLVKEKANILEKTAKQKQRYLAIKGDSTAQDTEQINDMIFDSLNAKLSLLKSTVEGEVEEESYN